jgi:imidazolonepropionase-like amidohydrolase
MKMKSMIGVLVLALLSPAGAAAEAKPGLIAIRGARIVPVVGEEIPEGIILVRNGRIEALGRDLAVPDGAEIVEAAGLIAYPGLIDPCSSLGMNEISNVAATVDGSEIGRINPQLRIADAIHMDSVHIPIARASGITAVHVVPGGSFIAGQSGIIRLSGRIPADMIVKSPAFMHIYFQAGPQFINGSMAPGGKPDDLAKELKGILENVRVYRKNRDAAEKNPAMTRPEFDEAMEFLIPVVEGRLPVMLDVGTEEEIKAAIKLVKEEKLKAVFFGAEDAWKAAADIKESGIPVILSNMYNFPSNWEDGYDAHYRLPAELRKAGVKFALASDKYLPPYSIDLPYQASKAAAFGLDRGEALKSVTIYPAEILGVADLMGSLEPGKAANIVLADGDILDRRTQIKKVFIDGRSVDLSNRYTELLEKYEDDN